MIASGWIFSLAMRLDISIGYMLNLPNGIEQFIRLSSIIFLLLSLFLLMNILTRSFYFFKYILYNKVEWSLIITYSLYILYILFINILLINLIFISSAEMKMDPEFYIMLLLISIVHG